MSEEIVFRTEEWRPRGEIVAALVDAAAQIEIGDVHLQGTTAKRDVTVPETALFEVELERLTGSETGEERYELEYGIRWTE